MRKFASKLIRPLWILVILEIIFILAPIAIAIVMSLGTTQIVTFPPRGLSLGAYGQVLADPGWTSAAKTSVIAAVLVMALSTCLGLSAAIALVRGRLFFKNLALAFITLPILTPIMVMALGIDLLLTQWNLTDTLVGLVLAQTLLAVPFVLINCMVSLRALDSTLEVAAASLGASPAKVFTHITLPLIRRGLLAGAVFAFLASWDDATVALFINGPKLTTLPVYLLQQIQEYVSPEVAAVSGYLILIAVFAMTLLVSAGGMLPSRRSARREEQLV